MHTWKQLSALVKRASKAHRSAARQRGRALSRLSKAMAAAARSGRAVDLEKLPAQKAYNATRDNAEKLEAGLAAACKALEHGLPVRKAGKKKSK